MSIFRSVSGVSEKLTGEMNNVHSEGMQFKLGEREREREWQCRVTNSGAPNWFEMQKERDKQKWKV